MGRGLLGILLASTILLAGCLAPVSPDWGGDLSVERNGDGTFTFESSLPKASKENNAYLTTSSIVHTGDFNGDGVTDLSKTRAENLLL